MTSQPSKSDLEAVFQRLRSIPANKTCFDCSAKNPTWASITYGVFICIDCSAVHRGLGVHLTFVRSTQLDTNWTWMQLRQMQVGGNSNALQFFTQHNCVTTDAQKKYNSRAAQLYREKIQQLAFKATQNNSELHIHPSVEEKEEKEVDFFTEQNTLVSHHTTTFDETKTEQKTSESDISHKEGPTVDFTMSLSNTEHKPTIGARKVQPKKLGLGAKKGGLGATKVKTNFADLEREAALAEESRLRMHEESVKAAALSAQEQEERDAAVRLAYRDLGAEQQKREEHLKKVDPRKAEQMERLGMGFQAKSGVSHSVLSDMQTIEQENLHSTSSSLSSLGKLRLSDTDGFFDEYSYGSGFSMNRNSNSGFDLGKDSFYSDTSSSKDSWVVVDDPPVEMSKSRPRPVDRTPTRSSGVDSTDIAQKKFGSAKAISSDQFFTDRSNDYEHQTTLSRFQGSSSISSSEFFGNGKDTSPSGSKFQAPDLEDVRESVRQGVTKVAGKISSLANGVMSSIQERYGY
ncbi:ADP-ribosylation factor GTPase-activating protein 2 isoform X2 [Photinus pyralis]|uniref:Arf-GAP domain-containing protein n=1 Tax=Photinus pyralis TaxID=7054 RepID=A0A1Y1KF27_PHOPY|nr:ADP-ribosylation factor GTPase-activating protein 2 isoform X2 [Photinus pyralis]